MEKINQKYNQNNNPTYNGIRNMKYVGIDERCKFKI